MRVLVATLQGQEQRWEQALRQPGLETRAVAVLGQEPIPVPNLARTIAALGHTDWVAFASRAAVEFARAELGPAWPGSGRVAAVGEGTAAAITEAGWTCALRGQGGGEDLADLLMDQGPVTRVILPAAADGRPELGARLEAAGIPVERLTLYRTLPLPDLESRFAEAMAEHRPLVLVLLSPSAGEALAARVDLGQVTICAIGPTTAEAARASGLQVELVALEPTPAGIAGAIRRDT